MSELNNGQSDVVLTLSEAATFLRVKNADLMQLVESEAVPVQKIGSEWRFLKAALIEWLSKGCHSFGTTRHQPGAFYNALLEELARRLENRLIDGTHSSQPNSERGSKSAVLRHFGVFENEDDAEAVLAEIYAFRKATAQ